MPFAKISEVKGWEDFGFRFKEGNDEPLWDDAARHPHLPLHRADDLVDDDAQSDAADAWRRPWPRPGAWPRQGNVPEAKALFTSGYHDAAGPLGRPACWIRPGATGPCGA